MRIVLVKQFFDGLQQLRFQRIFIVTARTVQAVTPSGATTAPLLPFALVKFMPAEPAFHARTPVIKRNLLSRKPLP